MYVCVYEEIIGSIKILRAANLLGVSEQVMRGPLVSLWLWAMRHAQDGIIRHATSAELDTIMGLPANAAGSPQSKVGSVTEVLVSVGLLERSHDENSDPIFVIPNWRERSGKYFERLEKDAESKKTKRAEKPKRQAKTQSNNVEKNLSDICQTSHGVQQNSCGVRSQIRIEENRLDQNRKEEIRKRNSKRVAEDPSESLTRSDTPKEGTPGTQVWEAYTRAMQEAWGLTPPKSAKTASVAKRLVGNVGIETALKLAAYYPTRRKEYYVTRGFPFEALLSDSSALLLELNAGIKLTKGVVKEIVSKEETENYCKFDQFRKETNPLLMNDEEYADWKKDQEALAAAGLPNQLTEGGSNESDERTIF